jgi:hypothetical protein
MKIRIRRSQATEIQAETGWLSLQILIGKLSRMTGNIAMKASQP